MTGIETAAEWPIRTIEGIAEKVAMGPFGSSIKVSTFVDAGVPVVSGQHLHGSKLDSESGFNFVTEEHADRLSNANVFPGDVVFTHAGSIGQVAMIPRDAEYSRYVISQRQFYMRCDYEKVIPEYVVAYFKSPEGQHQLLANTSSTGVPSIARPVSYLRTIPIPVPPIEEQRAIAHILGSLDDKIELNRRMNETLEAMARALFKSWFVDFQPVRAKAESRDTGLPKHIADLFPDSFEDSELGEIPKGWKLEEVENVAPSVGGSTPSTKSPEFWEGGTIHWTTPKDLSSLSSPVLLDTARKITPAGLEKISSGLLPTGTLLLSSRAPVGYLAIAQVPIAVNQGYIAIPPGGRVSPLWMLFWAEANMDRIKARAGGTTFQEISKTNFRPIRLIAPPSELAREFEAISGAAFQRIVSNERQSIALSQIRDTLLPNLVSGELRIGEPERFAFGDN